MGFHHPQQFTAEERQLLETLSRQCAQALLRSKRMEQEKGLRRWLSTVLKSIGDAVVATDVNGYITFMNPIAESLTSYSEVEAKGKQLNQIYRIIAEDSDEAIDNLVKKIFKKE